MVERDRLCLGESVTTVSGAEEDWELVAHEFAAALGQDRRTAGETCALLLAALSRGASDSKAVRQHAENDRGATPAGRLAHQERGKCCARKSCREQVSAARQVGGGKQTTEVSGTAKRAKFATQLRPGRTELDTTGRWA